MILPKMTMYILPVKVKVFLKVIKLINYLPSNFIFTLVIKKFYTFYKALQVLISMTCGENTTFT